MTVPQRMSPLRIVTRVLGHGGGRYRDVAAIEYIISDILCSQCPLTCASRGAFRWFVFVNSAVTMGHGDGTMQKS